MPSKQLRNRILSIIVSLALSFCLWVAISGQDMSTVDITVPLSLAELPHDLMVSGDEIPASVTFVVRANAAQVRFLTDRKPQLRLNVSTAREGHNVFAIPTTSLDLPRGVQVSRSNPAFIEFDATRLQSKVAPIRPVVSGQPDPAYDLASVVVEPDAVTVQGPQELIDAVEYIATVPIDVEGISRDANLVTLPALVDLDPALVVTPDELRVYVNLEERLAEKTFTDLPILMDGARAGFAPATLVMEPNKAAVTVSWAVSARLGLEAEALDVMVRVDTARLVEAGGQMELPVLVTPPVGVKVISIDPPNVVVRMLKEPENAD